MNSFGTILACLHRTAYVCLVRDIFLLLSLVQNRIRFCVALGEQVNGSLIQLPMS